MTQELDLTKLREVAGQATPGPWEVHDRGIGYEVHVGGHELNHCLRETFDKWDAAHIATFDPPTVLALLDRVEAAEQALDFHTQRDRELKTLLSMIACRLDEFCYEELASLIEDEPLDQWGEKYTSKLQAAEQAVARVRELADAWKSRGEHDMEYSETIPRDVGEIIHEGGAEMVNKANLIYRALDGGERQ